MYKHGMLAHLHWLLSSLLPGVLSESCRLSAVKWAVSLPLVVPQCAPHLSSPPSCREKAPSFWNMLKKCCQFLYIGPGFIWNSNSAGCHVFYLVHHPMFFLNVYPFLSPYDPIMKAQAQIVLSPLNSGTWISYACEGWGGGRIVYHQSIPGTLDSDSWIYFQCCLLLVTSHKGLMCL